MSRRRVRFTTEAADDLERLVAFLAERDGRAAESAGATLARALDLLGDFPFSCRKAAGGDGSPFLRELLVPFGVSGYVLLFEIEDRQWITVLAIRHQREDDYH